MTNLLPRVMTLEEAADVLQVRADDVLEEISCGRLRATEVAGNNWRVTDQALLEYLGEVPAASALSVQEGVKPTEDRRAKLGAKAEVGRLQPADGFSYLWPDKTEEYDEAYVGEVQVGNRHMRVRLGFTDRAVGGVPRRRAVVFFGEEPRLTPVVEFAGVDDFVDSGKMASIIKVPSEREGGLRQLRPYEPLPAEYMDRELVIYNHVITAPYATGSMAVLVRKEDREAMVKHALIRAKLKGWI